MLPTYEHIHLLYLAIGILLEVAANILMKLSYGFERKVPAIAAIICVFASFTALSFAIDGIHLTVAYAIWGGIGLVATTLLSKVLFNEGLRLSGWIGMAVVLFGVTLIKIA